MDLAADDNGVLVLQDTDQLSSGDIFGRFPRCVINSPCVFVRFRLPSLRCGMSSSVTLVSAGGVVAVIPVAASARGISQKAMRRPFPACLEACCRVPTPCGQRLFQHCGDQASCSVRFPGI